jgi:hypothetical protein
MDPAPVDPAPVVGEEVVADLCSRERGRILGAVWAVVRTRDPAILGPVAAALPQIEAATADVDLGGALVSNDSHLARAVQRGRLFAQGTCLCTAYPGHLMSDVPREVARGHVRVVGTVRNERQYDDDAICECTDCGRRYQVEHGESHHPWWQWTALDEKRRRR